MFKYYTCCLVVFSLAVTGCFSDQPKVLESENVDTVKIYRHEIKGELSTSGQSEPISVLIVPHHLVADQQIQKGFEAVNSSTVKRVILIGPNHFFQGQGQVITVDHDWVTNYGTIQSDSSFIERIVNHNMATREEGIVEADHSITALLPFVERFFPHVRFVPLLMREPISSSDARLLAKFLSQKLTNETLIIASIDFSHYVPKFAADFHDSASLAALYNLDFEFFSKKIDADSPQILMVLSEYLKLRGHEKFILLSHTNSATLINNPFEKSTTSHIVGYFHKGVSDSRQHMTVLLGSSRDDDPLLYKGSDFSLFYGKRFLLSDHVIVDRYVDPKTPPKSIIFEKNGMKVVIVFDNSTVEAFVHQGDAIVAVVPHGGDGYSSSLSWDPDRGVAGLRLLNEGKTVTAALCYFREETCI